jgi:hypothetical protein
MNLSKKRRRILEGLGVMNAQALGISELIVGTSRRARGKLTM